MPMLIDLERIQKVFTRRGERVVLIMPDSEPVVLVPLNEYEQFSQSKLPLTNPGNRIQTKATRNQVKPAPASANTANPELVDPLQGGLEDDDQYFPEPL